MQRTLIAILAYYFTHLLFSKQANKFSHTTLSPIILHYKGLKTFCSWVLKHLRSSSKIFHAKGSNYSKTMFMEEKTSSQLGNPMKWLTKRHKRALYEALDNMVLGLLCLFLTVG
ncbi:uncharacterized protein LOC126628341 isoform X2 [Malus sylvestris]|uniref:uncharacterized protein LOC126628341 isoform X2 n=1 Tax=Malus sylvestris TaxID=3752 RepID=UPI0021ABFAFD|nr:uncharacterized protein LOC126628341 isoform X2 [Malus sylvestris]